MTDAAAQRVLAAPELVELILLELDHQTLLCRAQRVSKQWHDIVTTSPRLQAMLFFRPIITRTGLCEGAGPVQNPQTWKKTWRLQDLFPGPEGDTERPQLGRKTGKPLPDSVPLLPSSSTGKYDFLGPWKQCQTNKAFTTRGVSWRHMLIQQPAITSFGQVIVRRRIDGTISTKVGKADCPDGVRMGHLWDTLRESMTLLKSDMCLMRLVWWEPNVTPFEKALYPLAQDVQNLFDDGAQLVLAVGFSECHPQDRFFGKFTEEYDVLCQCEEYEPLDFKMREYITRAGPSRRQSLA